MKKVVPVLFAAVIFSSLVSCMGQIKVVRDDFKNAAVVTMNLKESTEESMFKGGGFAVFSYSKEIQNNKVSPITIGMRITKAKNFFMGNQDMVPKGILKVDDKTFDINFGDTSAANITTVSSSTNAVTGGTQVRSSQHEEWNTKFMTSKQIDDAIVKGSAVTLRMYFGTSPMTYKINIKKVKEFISATVEKE